MSALQSDPSGPWKGTIRVPGDKSISHRALIFGGLAVGETRVSGLLEAEDVLATADAMRALGAEITKDPDGTWRIIGVGIGGLVEPDRVLDLGNSGTGVRLLLGVVATHPITTMFTGDTSLCSRPMGRVINPLTEMGAQFTARGDNRLPLTVVGSHRPLPITYRTPVPSAQVKSAILLAGLNTPGITQVIEATPTRDHTERMLVKFGANVSISEVAAEADGAGGHSISLVGQPELKSTEVIVPADPSSAAFLAVAGLIIPGSELELGNVGVNPLRAGLFGVLADMDADLTRSNESEIGGEPVADFIVRGGIRGGNGLKGVTVPAGHAPSMIDEFPILAMAAACATGTSRFEGLAELRIKESDRLSAIVDGLTAAGVTITATDDSIEIKGCGGPPPGGATIDCQHDHRIAMAFLVLGAAAKEPITVTGAETIATSWPGFDETCNGLGARIAASDAAPANIQNA
jgi:3-phosphoshikimate 1-carboxyvinyltransferase